MLYFNINLQNNNNNDNNNNNKQHYGKHHQSYVNNLNNLLSQKENVDFANKSLEDIIKNKSVSTGLFNNAAQVWNHDFYWESLAPPKNANENPLPTGKISEELIKNFGSFEAFKEQFSKGQCPFLFLIFYYFYIYIFLFIIIFKCQ